MFHSETSRPVRREDIELSTKLERHCNLMQGYLLISGNPINSQISCNTMPACLPACKRAKELPVRGLTAAIPQLPWRCERPLSQGLLARAGPHCQDPHSPRPAYTFGEHIGDHGFTRHPATAQHAHNIVVDFTFLRLKLRGIGGF